jgi:hypothetical protein
MKRQLVADALGLRKKRLPAELAKKPDGIERRPDIPEAPAPTV